MKAEVLFLVDKYENEIESKVTGKKKKAYVGQVGEIINRISGLLGGTLYDLEFNDGQKWCFERDQIEFVSEK